jgi:hypothetical protein
MPLQEAPDELQKQIDQLKKEKEKLEAEKTKLEAEKALNSATKPEDPNVAEAQKAETEKKLLEARKNLLDAQRALEKAKEPQDARLDDLKKQKELADAKKDLANSQIEAAKAGLFGSVTAGTFTGAVETKTGTGAAEANLLASRAIQIAASKISADVNAHVAGKPIYLFSVKDFPNFQKLTTFRFRKALVTQAYTTAGISGPEEEAAFAAPAIASAGLDALSKILGFFKTDFSVGGVEVKSDETQLVFSVSSSLSNVSLPAFFNPKASHDAVSRMTRELGTLVALRSTADTKSKELSTQTEQLEKGTDQDKKRAAELKSETDLIKTASCMHDAFIASLNTADSNGNLPIALIAQEFAIDDALHGGYAVLLVKLENTAGGYLVKKNLLTGLGAMPLYHMGGATASYVLMDGQSGGVLRSGVVPVHGGFVKAGEMQKEFAKPLP